jgi:hypothetical protein
MWFLQVTWSKIVFEHRAFRSECQCTINHGKWINILASLELLGSQMEHM